MNILREYLNKTGESDNAFAIRSKITQSTIWRILNNKVKPSPSVALKIEQATNGEVSRLELLYPSEIADIDKHKEQKPNPKSD